MTTEISMIVATGLQALSTRTRQQLPLTASSSHLVGALSLQKPVLALSFRVHFLPGFSTRLGAYGIGGSGSHPTSTRLTPSSPNSSHLADSKGGSTS